MRYDDHCSVFLDGIYAGFDLFSSNCIQTGCRLVKENYRRVLQEETSYGDSLLLTAGKLLCLGLETIRKFHHLVIDICLLGSVIDIFH